MKKFIDNISKILPYAQLIVSRECWGDGPQWSEDSHVKRFQTTFGMPNNNGSAENMGCHCTGMYRLCCDYSYNVIHSAS